MKLLIATMVASTFAFSSAHACGFGKTASHKTMTTASTTVKTEEAMSTFSPASKPVFEEKAQATQDQAPEKKLVVED